MNQDELGVSPLAKASSATALEATLFLDTKIPRCSSGVFTVSSPTLLLQLLQLALRQLLRLLLLAGSCEACQRVG